jgi:small-conductance mechanosensitive channel
MADMGENKGERAELQGVKAGKIRQRIFGRWSEILLMVLGVLLVGGTILLWKTDDAMSNLPFLKQGIKGSLVQSQKTLVDQTPWQTATALGALAVTQEELSYARQAEHLADHEVDQAFATALRQANLRQRTLTGEALALQQKVTGLEALVAADQAAVTQTAAKGGDDADVAKAQLGLDQDELSDARADLARASGDQRAEIQQELTTREAEVKKFDATGTVGEVALLSVKQYRTLEGLVGAWRRQRERYGLLLQAKEAEDADVKTLSAEHNRLEAQSDAQRGAQSGNVSAAADRVAGLKRMSLERQLMSIYDDRIDTAQRLSDVYAKWAAQVMLQHRIVEHLLVAQGMVIAVILVIAILLSALVKRLTAKESLDPRRTRTLSWIALLVVQVLALISILLVVFGKPSQLSTVIGLATAGLTVALQDFILAFVGWFVLMGRSGIGVGDVVEINSVAGEVVDIGLFRTTLMETGNWTANGHPTGRRVAFNNKYAISGQFFNFSTAGQWMWDEFAVPAPAGEETGALVERVQKAVAVETEQDARQAETEWRQISQQRGLSQYSAEPAVNVRPSATGVDLVVRYVTRASDRFERRIKLYACVLDALPGEAKSDAVSA